MFIRGFHHTPLNIKSWILKKLDTTCKKQKAALVQIALVYKSTLLKLWRLPLCPRIDTCRSREAFLSSRSMLMHSKRETRARRYTKEGFKKAKIPKKLWGDLKDYYDFTKKFK